MAECADVAVTDTWLREFAKGQESRRVHWSAAAWQQVLDRSLPEMLLGLEQIPSQEARFALISSYLTLVSEAIGLQLIYPHPPREFPNLFSVALERIIPALLRTVPDPKDKAASMSKLWNLCDAVAEQPAWVEAAFIQSLGELTTLENLSETCGKLQRELTDPAPQTLTSGTVPEALRYTALSLWPFGFFLPEAVTHCGPNVFLVVGRSPEVTRMFYVVASKHPRMLPLNGRLERGVESAKAPKWAAKLVSKVVRCELPVLSYVAGESTLALIFEGSQQLHLWQVKSE